MPMALDAELQSCLQDLLDELPLGAVKPEPPDADAANVISGVAQRLDQFIRSGGNSPGVCCVVPMERLERLEASVAQLKDDLNSITADVMDVQARLSDKLSQSPPPPTTTCYWNTVSSQSDPVVSNAPLVSRIDALETQLHEGLARNAYSAPISDSAKSVVADFEHSSQVRAELLGNVRTEVEIQLAQMRDVFDALLSQNSKDTILHIERIHEQFSVEVAKKLAEERDAVPADLIQKVGAGCDAQLVRMGAELAADAQRLRHEVSDEITKQLASQQDGFNRRMNDMLLGLREVQMTCGLQPSAAVVGSAPPPISAFRLEAMRVGPAEFDA